jgi:hypothetical protein
MRFALPVVAASLCGFLIGHGTETSADLFVLLTSIVLVYSAIAMSELLQALPRNHRASQGGSRPVGPGRLR